MAASKGGAVLTALAALALTLGIGLLDYLSGSEISFSVFYLAPTTMLAWRGGRGAGLAGAVGAAATWLYVDSVGGQHYSQPWIVYWNATVRLVFFALAALLVGRQKRVLDLERRLAGTDSLTGLMNARSFFLQGERVLALAARHDRPLTLAYVDLDDFKQVNDTRGHQEGDRLIQLVGEGLRRAVRSSDLAARLGGDEFGLLLPETGFAEAGAFVERLQRSLDAVVDRAVWRIGYSGGVVTFPTAPASLEAATAAADRLMYEVKRGGKGRWVHRLAGDRSPAGPR